MEGLILVFYREEWEILMVEPVETSLEGFEILGHGKDMFVYTSF